MLTLQTLFLLIGGVYSSLNGAYILLDRPTIETRIKRSLKLSVRKGTRSANLHGLGMLLAINGPIMLTIGIFTAICDLSPVRAIAFF